MDASEQKELLTQGKGKAWSSSYLADGVKVTSLDARRVVNLVVAQLRTHSRLSGRLERLVQEAQDLGPAHLLERTKDALAALLPPHCTRVCPALANSQLERLDHV